MQEVARKLLIDLQIEEAKDKLQDKIDQVVLVFGQEFVDELNKALVTVVGSRILKNSNNLYAQIFQDQDAENISLKKKIDDAEKRHTRVMSEINNLRSSLGAVRKMAKELREGMLKETNRLCEKSEPTAAEALLLNCEQKLKDILIRTKGVC